MLVGKRTLLLSTALSVLLPGACLGANNKHGAKGTSVPRIRVREHVLFDGHKGWQHDGITYRLACAAVLTQTPHGDLLCHWLSGSGGEPATDNCVLLIRSTDRGKTWSEPKIFVPAGKMAGAVTTLYPTADGRLIALGAHWPSDKHYTVWHYFWMESADSGHTWSKPQRLVLHDDHACVGRRLKLANGEFLFPASFFDERPKPLVGPVPKLARAKTEAEALAIPAEKNQRDGHKFCTHLHGCSVFIGKSEAPVDLMEYGAICNRPLGLLEPTCIQLKDGRIVMLMRAEWGGFLWRAESKDNGRTWTKAWQTDIPNPTSLANLLRLPDGRIALIHNATGGKVGAGARRDPLSIWISDDEMKSWSVKEDVIRGGSLAYPNGLILDNGSFVFVYDHNRRQVRYVEVDIRPSTTGE